MSIIRPTYIIVLMIIALVVGSGSPAQARGPLGRLLFGSAPASTTTNTTTTQSHSYSSVTQSYSDHAIAQRKADQQAAEGRMRHVGGSLGSGGYEGVGFSTRSADDAIRASCYWGQRQPTAIAVSRGANGYYATVLYR